MIYGYVRVASKEDCERAIDLQIDLLKRAGVPEENIYREQGAGTIIGEELKKLLLTLTTGDELIVKDLSRISRNTSDIFKIYNDLKDKGVAIKFLDGTDLELGRKLLGDALWK